jgi:hypothetical protein
MPPSDPDGKEIHYVISFSKDGDWLTRTFEKLPADSPFEDILKRTRGQSQAASDASDDVLKLIVP